MHNAARARKVGPAHRLAQSTHIYTAVWLMPLSRRIDKSRLSVFFFFFAPRDVVLRSSLLLIALPLVLAFQSSGYCVCTHQDPGISFSFFIFFFLFSCSMENFIGRRKLLRQPRALSLGDRALFLMLEVKLTIEGEVSSLVGKNFGEGIDLIRCVHCDFSVSSGGMRCS